jgi:7-cyano-7-deazaguanine synthase
MKKSSRPMVTVLLSGGIDSSGCVRFYLSQHFRVRPLFIDYGQPASAAELKSAHAISSFYDLRLRLLSIEGLRIPKSGEIIGRNLLLLSMAITRVGLATNLIALGIHSGTRYFDCSRRFTTMCKPLMEGYTDGRVQLGTPFVRMDKLQVWEYCKRNHVPINLTWSCEASSTKPCGSCLSCRDRESLLARS